MIHAPVLLEEVIYYLNPKPNKNFIDCTIGGGGHAEKILEKTGPKGKLLGLDIDKEVLDETKTKLQKFKDRFIGVNDNFNNLGTVALEYNFRNVDGILFDLGVSSFQIENAERGFSFLKDGPLDMRMGIKYQISNIKYQKSKIKNQKLTAADIVNKWPEKELVRIFKENDEKYARRIAKAIIKERKKQPIVRTLQLSEIIKRCYPQRKTRIHPATKVFQALRIEVNQELKNLQEALPQAVDLLKIGGRLIVISFHSGEDRIVKNFFKKEAKGCVCPSEFPKCICGLKPRLKILTKKPIVPSQSEILQNPRCHSAKMRVAEKI